MQLFGLANALLAKDRRTSEHGHLLIQRYAVTPLSHNCGVVGWVPACDTLHALVRDFRDARTQGRRRMPQRRFNVGVLEAMPKRHASTLGVRPERWSLVPQ